VCLRFACGIIESGREWVGEDGPEWANVSAAVLELPELRKVGNVHSKFLRLSWLNSLDI